MGEKGDDEPKVEENSEGNDEINNYNNNNGGVKGEKFWRMKKDV